MVRVRDLLEAQQAWEPQVCKQSCGGPAAPCAATLRTPMLSPPAPQQLESELRELSEAQQARERPAPAGNPVEGLLSGQFPELSRLFLRGTMRRGLSHAGSRRKGRPAPDSPR